MRVIPAGEFIMGSTMEQVEAAIALDHEGAQFPLRHEIPRVRIMTPAFSIGVYPVTNEQYARFLSEGCPTPTQRSRYVTWFDRLILPACENEPYRAESGFERHPVINVTWFGAQAYCEWAGLRLPTEIEWEKAARGSDGRIFPWGDEWLPERLCWWGSHGPSQTTSPVGRISERLLALRYFPDGGQCGRVVRRFLSIGCVSALRQGRFDDPAHWRRPGHSRGELSAQAPAGIPLCHEAIQPTRLRQYSTYRSSLRSVGARF
jgi:hypothetical protein